MPPETEGTPLEKLRGRQGAGPELVATRRDLHAHPKLGHQEHRTAARVADRLRSLDDEVKTGSASPVWSVRFRGASPAASPGSDPRTP